MDKKLNRTYAAFVVSALCVLFAHAANSCTVSPFSADDAATMVRKATGIYLARSERIEGEISTFEVIEVLKGKVIERFNLPSFEKIPSYLLSDYSTNRHLSLSFWLTPTDAREHSLPDCNLVTNYNVGDTYLIFKGVKTRRTTERIIYVDDYWYQVISSLTKYIEPPQFPKRAFLAEIDAIIRTTCIKNKQAKSYNLDTSYQAGDYRDISWLKRELNVGRKLSNRICDDNPEYDMLYISWGRNSRISNYGSFPIANKLVDLSSDEILHKLLRTDAIPLSDFGVSDDAIGNGVLPRHNLRGN